MPNLCECIICKEPRDLETEFHFNGQHYADGKKRKRKDCVYCCRKRRAGYFKSPEKRAKINTRRRKNYSTDGGARKLRNKKNALKQLYGLTIEEFDSYRLIQNYSCLICTRHESEVSREQLFVDHCHSTKKVRGLLCATCNSAIGLLKEDTQVMQNAIDYVNKHKK